MSSEYVFTNDTPVVELNTKTAFNALTDEERLYAHYLSKFLWFGSLIVLFQTSPESPLIFTLFRRLFKTQSIDELKELAKNVKFDDKEWQSLVVYISAFLSNMGNYLLIEETKFIPDLPKHKFNELLLKSKAFKNNRIEIEFLWDNIKDKMFSLKENELFLGFASNKIPYYLLQTNEDSLIKKSFEEIKGTTTYFSKNCTKEDSEIVKQFMENNKIEAWNTRVFKNSETNTFDIRFASILSTNDEEDNDYLQIKSKPTDCPHFVLSRGDYSPILKIMNKYLVEAEKNALNENEKKMIAEYVSHFRTGCLKAHKDGSRFWIKDKGSVVETYFGFINVGINRVGMSAAFSGFVAIKNKVILRLAEKASSFLSLLPWDKNFENDEVLQTDFTRLDLLTSLDVLKYAGLGEPDGSIFPNYGDIVEEVGYKNIKFNNILYASSFDPKLNYLCDKDIKLFNEYRVLSFQVQVGLRELLGNRSGKLFSIDDQNIANYNIETTINPLNNQLIDKWYNSGETYYSKFTTLSTAYDECRAECVGLYLCLDDNVMKHFEFSGEEAKNVIYVNWLSMICSGIESLQMYDIEYEEWLQPHSQALYVITRVLLESSKELVSIQCNEFSPNDEKPDLLITLNNKLIESVGKKKIKAFLLKLQVYKSMGDIESAQQMFDNYSKVSDSLEYPYLKYRDIVMARKKPRKLFVESSTHLENGKVVLKSYESTHEGLIQSFNDHLNCEQNIEQIIIDFWKKDINHFI